MLDRDELAWLNAYHAQVRRKIENAAQGRRPRVAAQGHGPHRLTNGALMETWVSAAAAILTTAAFVPQALHIIRHRETKAISLVMYVAFASGVAFWFLFGVLIHNWPIIDLQRHHVGPDPRHRGDEAPLRVGVQRGSEISLL